MLLEIIIFLLLGTLAGTFTGLFPGIHVNLIGVFAVSLYFNYIDLNPIYFITLIVSMSITHTFLDFVPSVYLGCPDTDTELSILPGHKMLSEGRGHEAVMLTNYGSLCAVFLTVILVLPLILVISRTYPLIEQAIPYLLILASLFLIFTEKNKIYSLISFVIVGIFGWGVLNLDMKEPLLPLLTGLFGASTLILSLKTKFKIPKQTTQVNIQKKEIVKPLFGSIIATPLCGFLPGLGSGQAAIMGNALAKTDHRGFLVLVGATNTLVMGFSFIALYLIGKTRTGAAAAIKELLGSLNSQTLILIVFAILIAGIISFFLTRKISLYFVKIIEKINYAKVSIEVLIILTVIVIIFSGFIGLFVFIISTLTGIYVISLNVRRTIMMSCILLPTIILYLL